MFGALFCIANIVGAAAAEPAEIYAAQCTVCHGPQGEGLDALNSPALAGQSAAYLQRQLVNFQTGSRGTHKDDLFGRQMPPIVKGLEQTQIADLANYLAGIEARQATPAEGDVKNGEKYYQSYCGSCHGPAAEGNDLLNSPNLKILSGAYQSRQYQHFLSGVRGVHKEDKFGRQMAMISNGLKDDKTLKDIIAYITSR